MHGFNNYRMERGALMPGVNKIIIVGNIGTDMEVKHTNSGKAVVNLRVAVTDHKDETEWFSCVAFEKKAETLGQWGRKGRQIYIEGRIRSRSWVGKDGQERNDREIVISNYQLLGTKPTDDREQSSEPRSYNQYRDDSRNRDDDGPIPF